MQKYVQRICLKVMEMLRLIIITNIRLVTLEYKYIYIKNQNKLLYICMQIHKRCILYAPLALNSCSTKKTL